MKSVRFASLGLQLVLSSCAITQIGSVMHPTISGGIVVHPTDGSETSWTPDRCASGDIEYFAGFDFLSSTHEGRLRVLLDPITGPVVRWQSGNGQTRQTDILRHRDCSKLDLVVQPTAFRVNDVREFAGHVELRCVAADGSRIEGRIDVDHCH